MWWVYRVEDNDREWVTSSDQAAPMLTLPQGRYYVTAKYGNGDVQASMEVALAENEHREVTLNMNVERLPVEHVDTVNNNVETVKSDVIAAEKITSTEVIAAKSESTQPSLPTEPGIKLRALPKQGASPITDDLYWEVFTMKKDLQGNRERLAYSSHEEPLFSLLAGRYYVVVKYGDIEASMEMEIRAGEQRDISLDLSTAQ
jgi:hypothetical protein